MNRNCGRCSWAACRWAVFGRSTLWTVEEELMVLQGSMVVPLAVEIGVKSYASTTNGSMCISRYLHDPPVAAPPSCPATVPNPSSKKEPAPRAASCRRATSRAMEEDSCKTLTGWSPNTSLARSPKATSSCLHHAAQLARHGQCRRSFRGPFSRGTAAGQSCRFLGCRLRHFTLL